jgi:hypothetical protein
MYNHIKKFPLKKGTHKIDGQIFCTLIIFSIQRNALSLLIFKTMLFIFLIKGHFIKISTRIGS